MQNDTLEQFSRYPVYGPKVINLLELLASIAARKNEEQSENSVESNTNGNK